MFYFLFIYVFIVQVVGAIHVPKIIPLYSCPFTCKGALSVWHLIGLVTLWTEWKFRTVPDRVGGRERGPEISNSRKRGKNGMKFQNKVFPTPSKYPLVWPSKVLECCLNEPWFLRGTQLILPLLGKRHQNKKCQSLGGQWTNVNCLK